MDSELELYGEGGKKQGDYDEYVEKNWAYLVEAWLEQLPGDHGPFLEWVEKRGADMDKLTEEEWDRELTEYKKVVDPEHEDDFWDFCAERYAEEER